MTDKNNKKAHAHSAGCLTSMTGFGRGHAVRIFSGSHEVRLDVEVKSVNHRFLDMSCKLPRPYASFEGDLRALLQSKLQRGRVEVYVSRTLSSLASFVSTGNGTADTGVSSPGRTLAGCNHELLNALYATEVGVLERLGLFQGLSQSQETELRARLVADLFRRPDVLEVPEERLDAEQERAFFLDTVGAAIESLLAMQQAEGASLQVDLLNRVGTLSRIRDSIQDRAAVVHQGLRSKMIERVKKLSPEVTLDETRLAAEVALLADRIDITEELVRLGSHLGQFAAALDHSPSGKRFDFLLQEIHREFNTIGSKAQDLDLQNLMLEAKMEVEKIREQVQNVT